MTLYTNVTISLVDALNGFEMDIQHLDEHKVCYFTAVLIIPNFYISKVNSSSMVIKHA
jgi:hypothetical protein